MTAPYFQTLPDLDAYRRDFAAAGTSRPLAEVRYQPEGLLTALPPAPAGRQGWPWDVETAPFAASGDKWPKLTIVVPSYQQGEFLEETLRSVVLQNYPRLECIVIDGGSSDGTKGIIERYGPWLSFARSAPDRGQGHAINVGFSLGSGELQGWINSDDFYLPGALRRVAEMRMRTRAEFIYGDSLDLDQASGRYTHVISNLAASRYTRYPGLVPSHATFWASARSQPIWEEQHCALDYELWIRLLPGLHKRHVPWPLGVFRRHTDAKTSNPKVQERWAEDALRNGRAHPELYRAGLGSRLLGAEFRAVQRIIRAWRRRGLSGRLEALHRECAWKNTALAYE